MLKAASRVAPQGELTFRGDRLYDQLGDASHALIKRRVGWFKAHRDILGSDILHVRAVTGQGLDAFLHVNARLPRRVGLAMLFNPTAAATARRAVPARTTPLGRTPGATPAIGMRVTTAPNARSGAPSPRAQSS